MSRITEILDLRVHKVIQGLGSTFSTREFIWGFMNAYEEDYVELLIEALPPKSEEKPKIIHKLHAQIGRYLLNNAKELGIEKIDDDKEADINPFGRTTPTQKWQKIFTES